MRDDTILHLPTPVDIGRSKIDQIIEILVDLAAGYSPTHPSVGICSNVTRKVSGYLEEIGFERLMSDLTWDLYRSQYPVEGSGYLYSQPNKWVGERGRRRRKIAEEMAIELVRRYDYTGNR